MRYPIKDTELFAVNSQIKIFDKPQKDAINVTEFNSYFDFIKNAFFGIATGEIIANTEGVWLKILYPTVIKRSWIKGGDFTIWVVGYILESNGLYRFDNQSVAPQTGAGGGGGDVQSGVSNKFDILTFLKANSSYVGSAALILIVGVFYASKQKQNA